MSAVDIHVSTIGAPSSLLADDIWSLLCLLDQDLNDVEAIDGESKSGSNIYPIKQG